MDVGLAFAFWGVSALFVITPGADWAYAMSAGMRGRGHALLAVSGMLAGRLLATGVVAAGVATVVAESGAAMTVLTVLGGTYLLWLGVQALRHPQGNRADGEAGGEAAVAEQRRPFAKGVGISLLNPKVFLLFLALLPQFTSVGAALPVGVQMFVLGMLHVTNCAIVYAGVAFGASALVARRPGAARTLGIASGVVMIGRGTLLVGVGVLSA